MPIFKVYRYRLGSIALMAGREAIGDRKMKKALTAVAAAIFFAPAICAADAPSQAQLQQWAQNHDFANLSIELAHEKQSQATAQAAKEEQYAKAAAIDEQQLKCNFLVGACAPGDIWKGPSPDQIRAAADTAYANAQASQFAHIGLLQAWVDKFTGNRSTVLASIPASPPPESTFNPASPPPQSAAPNPSLIGRWNAESQCDWGTRSFRFEIQSSSDGLAITSMRGMSGPGTYEDADIAGNSIKWTNWSGSVKYTGKLVSPNRIEGMYKGGYSSDCTWVATNESPAPDSSH